MSAGSFGPCMLPESAAKALGCGIADIGEMIRAGVLKPQYTAFGMMPLVVADAGHFAEARRWLADKGTACARGSAASEAKVKDKGGCVMRDYLTKAEAAQLLGCGVEDIDGMVRSEMLHQRWDRARDEAVVYLCDAVRVQQLRRY